MNAFVETKGGSLGIEIEWIARPKPKQAALRPSEIEKKEKRLSEYSSGSGSTVSMIREWEGSSEASDWKKQQGHSQKERRMRSKM